MAGHAVIRILVLDIDGVLTDGAVAIDQADREAKHLFYRDVDAIFQARREGLRVALITGERSPMVRIIAKRLEVESVIDGAKDKEKALRDLCTQMDIPPAEVCYVGDSDRDAPALALAGLGLAPSDASSAAKRSSHRVLASRGGRGAVEEALAVVREWNSRAPSAASSSPATAPDAASVQRRLVASLEESIEVKKKAVETLAGPLATAAAWMTDTFLGGGKLVLFGNGGSAADAQHVAGEFVGRFEVHDRRAWPAIALTTDTSILTALGNDFSFEEIFARQVEAIGREGDLVMAFSTSGNSPNVVQGVTAARAKGLRVIGLTGEGGGRLAALSDIALCVPSSRTARIQECHIAMCHALCEVVEAALR